MFLFISKVIEGPIFPKYRIDTSPIPIEVAETETNLGDKLERFQFVNFLPVGPAAYALLFLWSFIAGFAERFVPDALDRLMTRAQGDAKPAPANLPSGIGPNVDSNRVGPRPETSAESRPEVTSEDGSDAHLCDSDIPIQDITEDDELPAAKGGVA